VIAPWKIWRPSPRAEVPSVPPAEVPSVPSVIHAIELFWCDQHGFYLKGWLICGPAKIDNLSIAVGDERTLTAVSRHDRADVLTYYPDADLHCGFEACVECRPFSPAFLRVETVHGTEDIAISPPKREMAKPRETSLYFDFIKRVNDGQLSVLEIGSRIVGPASSDNRIYFPKASKYIGFDIHSAPGVDVVGDVHALSSLVGEESVEAIYSLAVMEHIQVPWIASIEMNKALKIGGLVFHSTVHSWPLHEMPNDFWRFSDEGLKVLFGPMFGFEVLSAGLACPVAMMPDHRDGILNQLPLCPGYAESSILARKIGPFGAAADLYNRARMYPKHDGAPGNPTSLANS
jgi:hypothetical protein